jgi:3-oxoacyl-[acyl-carrier protein] reductase
MPDLPLSQRHALVCGASSGIGHAAAHALARDGCVLTVVARRRDRLNDLIAQIDQADGRHHVLELDLSDPPAAAKAVADHIAQTSPIDILINNCGGPAAGPLIDAESSSLMAAFTSHVLASHAITQVVVPGMRERGFGRIINIISTSVVTPIRGLGVSNVVRGAMGNWVRTLASELGGDGITVNGVLPGFTATDRLDELLDGRAARTGVDRDAIDRGVTASIPVGRMGRPAEIADVIAFLASDASSYLNGVNLPVDGGRLAGQ